MLIRKLAGAVTLAAGLWTASYFPLDMVTTRANQFCLASCYGFTIYQVVAVIALGILLIADSAFCFFDRWIAFPAGALLSVFTIALMLSQFVHLETAYFVTSIILPVAALILDVKAAISQPKLSEENHPLNLPVFG